MGLDRGSCPNCGSRTTMKEKINGQYTYDLICLDCKYTGHNTEFRPTSKKKPSSASELLPFLEKAIKIGSVAAQKYADNLYAKRDESSFHDACGIHYLSLNIDARTKLYKELLAVSHDQMDISKDAANNGISITLKYSFKLDESDNRVSSQEISIYQAADNAAKSFLTEHLDFKFYDISMLT